MSCCPENTEALVKVAQLVQELVNGFDVKAYGSRSKHTMSPIVELVIFAHGRTIA